jgi:hypothetical protein
MRNIVRKYHDFVSDPGFLRFQHRIISEVYDQLGQGSVEKEGEVALVTRMANTLRGKSYKGLRIHCEKIHGSKSYVSFNFRDKPTTKELGDLILISIISDGRQRLLQKLCIVQNKVLHNGKSPIDLEQLFLLKNFPLFSGTKGLLRGASDVMFLNTQMCLGAYGFFEEPGEFVYVNAGILSNILNGSRSFVKTSLGSGSGNSYSLDTGAHNTFGIPWFDDPMLFEELYYRWKKHGFLSPSVLPIAPFFSSRRTLHDLHDFIRAWTSLQVGEIVFAMDYPSDKEADRFANSILRTVGFGDFIDLNDENINQEFNAGLTVMVSHFDLSQE